MGSKLTGYSCASILLFTALSLHEDPKTPARAQDQDAEAQVIQMTARKYQFSPSQVRVKHGMRVLLKITAIDRDHGFACTTVPDGAQSSTDPGLVEFTSRQGGDGWKLKKGRETTIEFFAKTPGRYEFWCSVVCGIHPRPYEGPIRCGAMIGFRLMH